MLYDNTSRDNGGALCLHDLDYKLTN